MSENIISKFCALGKQNTLVYPKAIPGYTSPEPQVLTENKQQIKFIYTPIEYKISYELNGGYFTVNQEDIKDTYTVEDPEYIPSSPQKENCVFTGWNIRHTDSDTVTDSISGIGDVIATATWRENAILLDGALLHKDFEALAGGDITNIMAIQQSPTSIKDQGTSISCTKTPIWANYSEGIIYTYCEYDIYCNPNMDGAFEDMILLRDISALYNMICNKNTSIARLFSGCSLLADLAPIDEWADGEFSDSTDAFKGTIALSAGRVPEWYRWDVTVNYMSSNGSIFESIKTTVIPNDTIYSKSYNGYESVNTSIIVDKNGGVYSFIYNPIKYKITYIVDGEEMSPSPGAIEYTIEDVDYYPPDITKEGYTFTAWNPSKISHGEYGDKTFIGTFNKI